MMQSRMLGTMLLATLPLASLPLAILPLLGAMRPAAAQERGADHSSRGGVGDRAPYVTSTGQTVPRPGQSQSGGTTPLDKGIQNEDNKIDGSICKGC